MADSHSFAIPNNVGKPATPEKHAAVLEVIKWMEKHTLFLGHCRPHSGEQGGDRPSAEYKAMQPNASYAPLADNAAYDPRS